MGNSTSLRTIGSFVLVKLFQGCWNPLLLAAWLAAISVQGCRWRLFIQQLHFDFNSASTLASFVTPGFPAFATLLLSFWQILLSLCWQNASALVLSPVHVFFSLSVACILFLFLSAFLSVCLFIFFFIPSICFSLLPTGYSASVEVMEHCQLTMCRQVVSSDYWYQK